jgi:Kelch motif
MQGKARIAALLQITILVAACTAGPPPTATPGTGATPASTTQTSSTAATPASTIPAPSSAPSPAPQSPEYPLDPAMFTILAPLSQARFEHTATMLPDGRVLIAGGRYLEFGSDHEVLSEGLRSVEIFDPVTRRWSAGPDMERRRQRHVALGLADGRVLVAGGNYSEDGPLRDATGEIFDPMTGEWSAPFDLPLEPASAVVLLDGTVLLLGHDDEAFSNKGYSATYDPESGAFGPVRRVAGMSIGSMATLLRNGSVLAAGSWRGYGDGPPELRPEAAIYDPGTGVWTATTPMREARQPAAIVTVDDGRALIVSNASGELYDPTAAAWTTTGATASIRDDTQLVAFGDGRVLAIGSSYGNIDAQPIIEVLDSVTGTWSRYADFRVLQGLTATFVDDESILITGGLIECRFGQACESPRVVPDAFLLAVTEAP